MNNVFFLICKSLNIIDFTNLSQANVHINSLVTRFVKKNIDDIISDLLNHSVLECLYVPILILDFPTVRDFVASKYRMVKSSAINVSDDPINSEIDMCKLSNFLQRFGRIIMIFHFDGPNEDLMEHFFIVECRSILFECCICRYMNICSKVQHFCLLIA